MIVTRDLRGWVCPADAPILDALARISESQQGAVFCVEADGRLAGVLTDGDFMVPSHVAAILDLLDAARAEVDAQGVEPVVVHGLDGRVVDVERPAWSARLGAEAWIGTPVDDLAALIAGSLGGTPKIEIRPWRSELIDASIAVGDERLRAVVGEWVLEGRYHLRALVTPVAS